jgi:hypothetical protein
MLNAMEAKVTAVVADGLQSRAGIVVVQAPAPLTASAGQGTVRVSLSEWSASSGFQRDSTAFPTAAATRRILGLDFTASLEFLRAPTDASTAESLTSRSLLLEDMSLVSHTLAAEEIRAGKAFIPAAPDPGFEVLSFELTQGSLPIDLAGGSLGGLLEYRGRANIWPPNISEDGGLISTVDAITTALPIASSIDRPVTPAGGSTKIRLRSLSAKRSLALTVASDLPPAQRGVITSGTAGAETGVRIVAVTQPETVIDYQAPTGSLGSTRVEFVAVYVATDDLRRGILLGSVAVRLQP